MENIADYLPFIIPLLILQIGLAVTALVHVIRHPRYRFGSRPLWIVIVLLFSIIGPVVYFAFGRGEQ
jgi:hypothetical protein